MSAAAALQLRQYLEPITIPKTDRLSTYRNWARSYACTPATAFRPTSEEQCVTILRLAALEGQTVRAVGSGHSPSDLPCTMGFMIRMDKLNRLIEVRLCAGPDFFPLNCTAFQGPTDISISPSIGFHFAFDPAARHLDRQ